MKRAFILISIIITFFSFRTYADDVTVEIETGDYFLMGKYNNTPILWRCVVIDSNGVLLMSDRVLCNKAFDAGGFVNTGSHGRSFGRSYGSNYWADSNIRTWLNSEAAAGEITWPCGNAPEANNVISPEYAYNNEKGFMNEFTSEEISLIKTVSLKSVLAKNEYENMADYGTAEHKRNTLISEVVQNYDTAYGESVSDRIFLPDVEQLYETNKNITDYHKAYNGDGNFCRYWLRTARADMDEGNKVRYVSVTGKVDNDFAKSNYGIRPAFYLSETAVIDEGDGTSSDPYTVIAPPPSSGSLSATAVLPAYSGTESNGWVLATVRNSSGSIIKTSIYPVTLNTNGVTTVSVIIENTDFTPGNLFDIYAWDTSMLPLIDDEHYVFAVINGQIGMNMIP